MLTVVVGLGEVVRVLSMIVLIYWTIQQVLWIITHELSDSGRATNKQISQQIGFDYASVVSPLNTRWLCVTMLIWTSAAIAKEKFSREAYEAIHVKLLKHIIFPQRGNAHLSSQYVNFMSIVWRLRKVLVSRGTSMFEGWGMGSQIKTR